MFYCLMFYRFFQQVDELNSINFKLIDCPVDPVNQKLVT